MDISFKAKPISLTQAENIRKDLLASKKVDIICHTTSDEDTVASAVAMGWFLKSKNIPARIIADKAEETYRASQNNLLDITKEKLSNNNADTVLCMDFSSFSRVNDTLKNQIKNSPRVICIDHHHEKEIQGQTVYVDTTAKSCSGIVVRLFEALGIKAPEKISTQLYCGMLDDLKKNNCINFSSGIEPIKTPIMQNDKNTLEVYQNLEKNISAKSKEKVVKHLNVLASLNKDEQAFKESLPSRIQYNSNKKFGYVVIPMNDKEWENIGKDNKRTSVILGNFRLNMLEKEKDLDTVAVFYEDNNGYRISVHSKNDNVLNFFNHIKKNINPEFSGGGHEDRGGGLLKSTDPDTCKRWVDSFVRGSEEFFKD